MINQLKHDKIEEEKEFNKKYGQNEDTFFFKDTSLGNKPSNQNNKPSNPVKLSNGNSPKPTFQGDMNYKSNKSPTMFGNVPVKPKINLDNDDLDAILLGTNNNSNTNNQPNKPLDFDTDVILKKDNTMNPRKRSARNFIEKTNNEISYSKPTNQFQFNNNNFSNISSNNEPIIINSEFPSRRKNLNYNSNNNANQNNGRYNDIGKILDNDDGMIIGDSFNKEKKTNNNSSSNNDGNDILFGMKSRRSHNFK